MTDYLLLMRSEGDVMAKMSPQEMEAHFGEWGAWMGGLAQAGRLKSAKPLGDGARVVSADVVTDGPYAEAKDVVGGYVLVACESMDHAIETARGCPIIGIGGLVEVRETEANVLE